MTRDEFIEYYIAASKSDELDDEVFKRVPEGFSLPGGYINVALPCRCDDERCNGWQMASGVSVRWVLVHEFGYKDANSKDSFALDTHAEGLALAQRFYLANPQWLTKTE